ncbi:hypothetical protein GOA89_14995 [Sinorhizobium meliloti]|nr:hypothetical protein [Sinorhizobium meliloti]MDW9847604.1 hypothetical protein [Sinorhizobium meliloti]MDX0144013.1 hypothetical protein [Sinorhizobium meliloti]MDX0150438.1 hypothetical protein [Sinorhizobium meliloti]MDX0169782.1 hypothetical protein [Sinorhizobium meliloti]
MAGFGTFERDIKLATADLERGAINKALAAFARSELQKVIATGQASATYERYVNGRRGASEETVQAPGPILYEFANWPLVIRTAIGELVKRAPHRTGRYASGFVVLANWAVVRSYSEIRPEDEVVIFNVRPYTRRIEAGANRSAGKRHFDQTRRVLANRFRGAFAFETRYLQMRPGIHPEVPYVLRQAQGRRRDRQAGSQITYPSIVMKLVD